MNVRFCWLHEPPFSFPFEDSPVHPFCFIYHLFYLLFLSVQPAEAVQAGSSGKAGQTRSETPAQRDCA